MRAEGRHRWWCQHLLKVPPAQLQLFGITGASLRVQKWFSAGCWDFAEHSCPTAAFPRVAARAPQVGEQRRGGSVDVGTVTCVSVGEGGGTRQGPGGGWLCVVPWCCTVKCTAGAEIASPGVCHWLMKMDLELLGDGVEKDGKESRGDGEQDTFPLSALPSPFPEGLRCTLRHHEGHGGGGVQRGSVHGARSPGWGHPEQQLGSLGPGAA